MRTFHSKVELVNSIGDPIRYLPGAVAANMVKAGAAEIAHSNGKVRSIRLLTSAATHGLMIGPLDGRDREVLPVGEPGMRCPHRGAPSPESPLRVNDPAFQ